MLPPRSDERWKLLVTGMIKHDFKLMTAGLMLSMINRQLNVDNSVEYINMCTNKIFDFFQRYESILQEDIDLIFIRDGSAPRKT